MEATASAYDFVASRKRLDDILALPAGSFEEVDSLPARDKLTYTNGYYANCAAIFVDIRRSSELPSKYQRPQLARIYRAFISEMVALLKSHSQVREINIVGDCVWAVVDSKWKTHIDELFCVAAMAHSLVDVINSKLEKKGYKTPIAIGVGLDYGRALMIKAGYSGSGINDVVYMGDVVNSAAKLAGRGDSGAWSKGPIFMSSVFHDNMQEDYRKLCTQDSWGVYRSDAFNVGMNDWVNAQ